MDLLIEGEPQVSLGLLGALADEFGESRLPWQVDNVDRAAISPEFGRIVDAGKVPFPMSA